MAVSQKKVLEYFPGTAENWQDGLSGSAKVSISVLGYRIYAILMTRYP
jgi:hypothetical protein